MKIIGEKNILLKGIQTVQNVVGEKTVIPILSNMVIETVNGGIQIIGTDLKTSILYNMPIEVVEKGSITISAKKINEIIRELPDTNIEIEAEEQKVKISCEKINFMLFSISKDEFPKFPSIKKGENNITIKCSLFKNMVKKIIFASAQDDSRYILNGALLKCEEDYINLTATDGHRLSYYGCKLKNKSKNWSAIIPSKTLNEISKVINDISDENILIFTNENKIEFSFKNIKIISSLIDGKFPNTEDIINKKYKNSVILNTKILLKAIRRVSIVAVDKSNSIDINFDKDMLKLSAKTPEIGEGEELIPIKYNGDITKISLNYKYILDAIKTMDCNEVSINFNDSTSSVEIKPIGKDEATHIIMPIRSK